DILDLESRKLVAARDSRQAAQHVLGVGERAVLEGNARAVVRGRDARDSSLKALCALRPGATQSCDDPIGRELDDAAREKKRLHLLELSDELSAGDQAARDVAVRGHDERERTPPERAYVRDVPCRFGIRCFT